MTTDIVVSLTWPLQTPLQSSSQNAAGQESTLTNRPHPPPTRTATGSLRPAPQEKLQSRVCETGSKIASIAYGGFNSVGRSFLGVIKSMNSTVLLLGLFIATAGCVPAYMGLSFQAWTARKDYLQECRENFVRISLT